MRLVASGVLSRSVPGTDRACLTFPAVAALSDGTLLATLRAGDEKDSAREGIEVYRSGDGGMTWSGPTFPFSAPMIDGHAGSLKLCYVTELAPGHLLAAAMWVDRTLYPGEPLFNARTEGCLPMAILLSDSQDNGATWSAWRQVPMPDEIGPPSLTSPVMKLADGRLAMSIETNKPYLDGSKWLQRAVFLHSGDGGANWSAPTTVAQDPEGRIFNWDLRCGVAPDGRVVSFAWTYDSQTTTYLNIHRRVSADGGLTWTDAEDIGVADQAARPAILSNGGLVLAWVDRFGSRSIRARHAADVAAPLGEEVVVYAHPQPEAASADTGEMLASMGMWNFGLPSATALPDGDALVVYYAGETGALDIRWARLRP